MVKALNKKWSDFLFTLSVRFMCGAVLGALVGFLLCVPAGRGTRGGSILLMLVGDGSHPHRVYLWFIGWALGGGLIAMLTTPKWQRPWYKRTPINLDQGFNESPDSLVITDDYIFSNEPHKSVHIQITNQSGRVHNYSSVDEVPQEYRKTIDSIGKKATPENGAVHSTTEISESGDAVITRTSHHTSSTQYRFVDESGVEHAYNSLAEMPPELRDAVIVAKKESSN